MMTADWRIFDALTCDHPMLADIKDWMLPPFSDKDKERWPPIEKENVDGTVRGNETNA